MAAQIPTRLGDILIRARRLKPHQLGVALEVQRRLRLPLGQVLLGLDLISPLQLGVALLRQKLMRLPFGRRRPESSADMVSQGREMLEQLLAESSPPPASEPTTDEKATRRLRAELAGLPPGRVARIVETDDKLKERIISGNF